MENIRNNSGLQKWFLLAYFKLVRPDFVVLPLTLNSLLISCDIHTHTEVHNIVQFRQKPLKPTE